MTTSGLFPARPLPASPPALYSLAHEGRPVRRARTSRRATSLHYVASPIYFVRPPKGIHRMTVACPTCQKIVIVLVRSPAAVKLERAKRVAYIVLVALACYAFIGLIPWDRFLGSQDTCVGLPALFLFGAVALYNGARVIAPEAALLVDLPGKPFLDILPSFGGRDSHTILRKK